MKLYKVKSLAVSGLGNKVHKCRDIVKESNFQPGRAEELVKSGHLVPYEEPKKEEKKPEGEKEKVLTKKEIIAKLQEKKIPFDGKSNVATLKALLDSSEEPKKEEDEDDDQSGSGSLDTLKENLPD